MTSDQVFIGVGLTLALAVAAQIVARRLRVPSLIILLPTGFVAGWLTHDINPNNLLGTSFQPIVSLSVAVILYDAGLGLDLSKLTGHTRRVVMRLIGFGVPFTFVVTAIFSDAVLGLSHNAAWMLGAILVVSGPTVIGPLLAAIRPTERPRRILAWEGSLIDPVGALLGAAVFHAITTTTKHGVFSQVGQYLASVGVGIAGALVGVGILWALLCKLRLGEALGTSAQLASVVLVAAVCDALRSDTGLIAAIAMGLAVANIDAFETPSRRPFFEILVQLIIGVLFISISATVTPESVGAVILPSLGLVALLVFVVRPLIAELSALGTDLTTGERRFVGWMAPRGIVAAATASAFAPELVARGEGGATNILPTVFLVIVMTVTLYGLTAGPVARRLHVARPESTRPLIVGGDPWVVSLGRALKSVGVPVLMWAEPVQQRADIVAAGLELAPDDLIADATGEGVELDGVTTILLLTGTDAFNALAAAVLQGGEGGEVYRVAPAPGVDGAEPVYAGADTLFGPALTGDMMARRCQDGAEFIVGATDPQPPPGHDLLFRVRADGRLDPVTASEAPPARDGDTIVMLGPPSRDR